MTAFGLDIGGSGLRARAVASTVDPSVTGPGVAGPVSRRPLDRRTTLADLLARAAEAVAAASPSRATQVTVAIPAFVRPDGTLTDCPSLPALSGVPLGRMLADRLGVERVEVVPDVHAATVAEGRYGAGRGVDRFLCVAVGTGVNAAALVGGRPVETAFGCLGDAGHVLVDPDGPHCPCGGRGCLEAVASGFALARDGRPLGHDDARSVTAAARGGDEDAQRLLARAGTALGRAMASWSALLWPGRIAVAGGVAGAGELLLAPARAELRRVGTPYIVGAVEVVAAELGADATLIGACTLAGR